MKIFCIGFHKTGTTSLNRALSYLGYRVHGGVVSRKVSSREQAREKARELCKEYDALEDMPWPIIYKWLDEEYDNGKFILTVRPEGEWLESVLNHFGNWYVERHKWIYGKGDPSGNKNIYLKRYKKHNKNVLNHFEGRIGEDLLVMDITSGDGWEKLCPFLGEPVPIISFPMSNISDEKWRDARFLEKVGMVLRRKTVSGMIRLRQKMEWL
jgi:hypothetical protein